MTYQIRRMIESDIDAVYAIEESVHIAPWSKSILRDCVRVGYDCRVFELNNDTHLMIGGYVICRLSERCAHILNFCIAKSCQSKGYGRQFLQHILDSFTQMRAIDSVILEVRPSNRVALNLYKRIGFEQVEIKPAYYTDHDTVEDAILLKKTLRW